MVEWRLLTNDVCVVSASVLLTYKAGWGWSGGGTGERWTGKREGLKPDPIIGTLTTSSKALFLLIFWTLFLFFVFLCGPNKQINCYFSEPAGIPPPLTCYTVSNFTAVCLLASPCNIICRNKQLWSPWKQVQFGQCRCWPLWTVVLRLCH